MTTYGAVIVSRNDNYGGNLNDRATYALNSCLETYDEVIYVDWNSRDKTLIDEIEPRLLKTGKLKCIIVTPEEHKEFTKHFNGAQPCSEVLGRNVGLRRLTTDFLCSTNIDEINPPRSYLEELTTTDTMTVVARRGVSLDVVREHGYFAEIKQIRDYLITQNFPKSWEVTREPYSLVEWCGDLQIAHRDVWYAVKGFEETQLGVGVHDSFVQRKVVEFGYKIAPSYTIPLWHLDHTKTSDYVDEHGLPESVGCLYGEFIGCTNTDSWGQIDYVFKEYII